MTTSAGHLNPEPVIARQILLSGKVQGVGFRPFVYRLAHEFNITGWVQNLKGQVRIHAEGSKESLQQFTRSIIDRAPSIARPVILETTKSRLESHARFEIRTSDEIARADIHVPTDYHLCNECLQEMLDPEDRRYHYPFINCTQCGPRYTLIDALPYDRPNTSMAIFPLCKACLKEYEDPLNRRFHAEPVACPDCGPVLEWCKDGKTLTGNEVALEGALEALKQGMIVAVKGVGGYHLVCDASSDQAVNRLRTRKHRPDKPLAVMFPVTGKDGLDQMRKDVLLAESEANHVTSPSRPIVLARKRTDSTLSSLVSRDLNEVGVFLPYSPLHYLLLDGLKRPIVATSANISGEPVITDKRQAESRLSHVADAWLHHDRTICRPADDSVFRHIDQLARPIRIGRGISPLELELPVTLERPLLAVGGHMKNSIALAWDNRIVIFPHIGDLDSPRSMQVFRQSVDDLQMLYQQDAEIIVHDAHPGYASHRWAKQQSKQRCEIFHHHAHASSLAIDYPGHARWLVFTWDGVGLGTDGTLWGGEALYGCPGNWQRVASFTPFSLPGGEQAAREPWRSAAALCWEADYPYTTPADSALLKAAWNKQINAPRTTAVGRLFDAAAAMTGLVTMASYEGQGPMQLEAVADDCQHADALPLNRNADNLLEADWRPLLPMLSDESIPTAQRAGRFHAILAATLVQKAIMLREAHGPFTIGLAGGVFQNRQLTERAIQLCRQEKFGVCMPTSIPVNDGGLCAGQVIEAAAILGKQQQD